MTEALPDSQFPPFGRRNLDAFFGYPHLKDRYDEYLRRGLIPTNNLSLFFRNDHPPELAPGIPNRHDYRQRPFGDVIEGLRVSHPDLWETAVEIAARKSALTGRFSMLLAAGESEEARVVGEELDEVHWAKAEIYDQVFRIIAPQLEESGIDPLDVCL